MSRLISGVVWAGVFLVALIVMLLALPLMLLAPERRHATRTRKFVEITGRPLLRPKSPGTPPARANEVDDVDVVPEGLGPKILRRYHSPTWSFEQLELEEQLLWSDAIARVESGR